MYWQNNDFVIGGDAKGFEENTIVKLRDTENNRWADSVKISNEKFKLIAHQTRHEHTSQYFLFVGNKKDIIPIFIGDNDTLRLSLDYDNFPQHKIIQSGNQREYEKFDSIFTFQQLKSLDMYF